MWSCSVSRGHMFIPVQHDPISLLIHAGSRQVEPETLAKRQRPDADEDYMPGCSWSLQLALFSALVTCDVAAGQRAAGSLHFLWLPPLISLHLVQSCNNAE